MQEFKQKIEVANQHDGTQQTIFTLKFTILTANHYFCNFQFTKISIMLYALRFLECFHASGRDFETSFPSANPSENLQKHQCVNLVK